MKTERTLGGLRPVSGKQPTSERQTSIKQPTTTDKKYLNSLKTRTYIISIDKWCELN